MEVAFVPIFVLQGEAEDADSSMSTSMVVSQQRLGGEPKIKPIFLELRITNQQMHLHPSIEVASHELFSQLTTWQNIVLNLPRIQHSRYQAWLHPSSARLFCTYVYKTAKFLCPIPH